MEIFDYPNVNVGKKTNEQNMQAMYSYMCNTADQMNYVVSQLTQQIENLRNEVEELKNGK